MERQADITSLFEYMYTEVNFIDMLKYYSTRVSFTLSFQQSCKIVWIKLLVLF